MNTVSDNVYSYKSVDPLRRQRIDAGEAALNRIDKHVTFYDWHQTGVAILELHNECWERSGSRSAKGKGYIAVFRVLTADKPKLANLEKGTRSCAKWMAEHWENGPEEGLPGIEEWHASLATKHPEIARVLHHPVAVKRHYLKNYPTTRKDPTTDPYAPDEDAEASDAGDDYEGFGERVGDDRTTGKDDRASGAGKELWLHSLTEIWEQGEDEWRAEFLEEATAHSDILEGVDDEIDRLKTAAVNREVGAAGNVKTGGVSDETVGVAVLDAADHIAAVRAGEIHPPAADEVFPADLGDSLSATKGELQKALKKPRRTRKTTKEVPSMPMTEEQYDRERARISAEFPEHMSKPEFERLVAEAEKRLGRDEVARIKKAHRNGRYRQDWSPILKELAGLQP